MKAILQSLKELGPAKLAAMGGVAVLLIGFFIFLGTQGGSSQMGLLYSNLPMEESGRIVQELETSQTPYEIRGNGTQIFVKSEDVGKTRLRLAAEGLPSQGTNVGYEIFDQSEALGTSNFTQNVKLMRALEGELGRTIGSMKDIKSARVHLVVPERELFSRQQKPPTASVAIEMANNKDLGKEEIQAIRHLVATAVPGLDLNKITIVDNKGRLLARGAGDGNDIEGAASDADEYRTRYERRMQEKLVELLERTIGQDNVQVNVSADIDFDRVVRNSEQYDPEGQVPRSVQSISENENTQERKADTNVTVRNNLPDPNPDQVGLIAQSQREKSEETTNFEISKTVENQVQEVGTVNRLSVAVLVNGTFTLDAEGNPVYAERPQAELDQISRLVKSAVGFDGDRGDSVEVINMPFSDDMAAMKPENPLDWLKQDFHNILQTGILGIVAILAILLVIRPLVTKAIESSNAELDDDEEGMDALTGPDGSTLLTDQRGSGSDGGMIEDPDEMVQISNVEGAVRSSTIRKITSIIDSHPNETLGVLRNWMSNG